MKYIFREKNYPRHLQSRQPGMEAASQDIVRAMEQFQLNQTIFQEDFDKAWDSLRLYLKESMTKDLISVSQSPLQVHFHGEQSEEFNKVASLFNEKMIPNIQQRIVEKLQDNERKIMQTPEDIEKLHVLNQNMQFVRERFARQANQFVTKQLGPLIYQMCFHGICDALEQEGHTLQNREVVQKKVALHLPF